jgi:hypothetical protein
MKMCLTSSLTVTPPTWRGLRIIFRIYT